MFYFRHDVENNVRPDIVTLAQVTESFVLMSAISYTT